MGFLMLFARKNSLQYQDNDIQYQLQTINNQLNDYTSYASILSQGTITQADLASLPTSLFSEGMSDLMNIEYNAMQIANSQYSQAMNSGFFNNTSQQVQILTQQKMRENARQQLRKQLQIKLNEKEKSLQAKKTRLEALDAQIQQELQALNQRIPNEIKNSISNYGLQG